MKPFFTLVIAAFFPVASMASEGTEATAMVQNGAIETPDDMSLEDATLADEAEDALVESEDGLLFLDAREVNVREFIWERRIVVVMADTPEDPQFTRQLAALRERESEFVERDVVVIFDANPEDMSALRQVLRPRGFMTAIIDKDGEVKARRPAVRSGRELMAVIDRFPTRREEILERLPSGR